MKLTIQTLPILALILFPLTVHGAAAAAPAPDTRLEAAISDLAEHVAARCGTREDFQRVRELLVARAEESQGVFFTPCKVRGRFLQAVDDLEQRAQRAQLRMEDVCELQLQVIEARLDAAVEELAAKAKERGATREDFQRVRDLLVQRARATAYEIDSQTVRARLTGAIDLLEAEAQEFVLVHTHFQRYWAMLIEHRLERALLQLQRRVEAGKASRADYQRVADQVLDRAELALEIAPEPCG